MTAEEERAAPLYTVVKLDRPIYLFGRSTIEADGVFADWHQRNHIITTQISQDECPGRTGPMMDAAYLAKPDE